MNQRVPARSHGARLVRAERSFLAREAVLPLERFLHSETAGAIVLLAAVVAALLWANSPWAGTYFAIWKQPLGLHIGSFSLSKDLRHWINDGLMALFFFVVGLEIKRELVRGELAGFRKASLPAIAALGGMAVPAAVYLVFNSATEAGRGWGVPMATDIAFAVGVMALLGSRIQPALRVFLLALAIADDLGAIIVIAIFYTGTLSLAPLLSALFLVAVLLGIRRLGVSSATPYLVVSLGLWAAVLQSGIHATISGVILAFLVPIKSWFSPQSFDHAAPRLLTQFRAALQRGDTEAADAALGEFEELTYRTEPAAERLQREVHPWVSYVVLPLFALANTGLALSIPQLHAAVSSPVALGIFCGLVLGKPLGIAGFCWLAVRTRLATLPAGLRWIDIVGMGAIAGIGFTVSLFITNLAFESERFVSIAKASIVAASIVAGLAGYLILRTSNGRRPAPHGAGAHPAMARKSPA